MHLAAETRQSLRFGLLGAAMRALEDKYYVDDADPEAGKLAYDGSIPDRVASRKFKRLSTGELVG